MCIRDRQDRQALRGGGGWPAALQGGDPDQQRRRGRPRLRLPRGPGRHRAPHRGADRLRPPSPTSPGEPQAMSRFIDLSVTVDENTFSPPSTNMTLEVTPHRRGPGFWQVSSVNQSLHTGAHIDSPLHVFKNGITTAEITLDQVMGEALVVDLSWCGANHEITIEDLKNCLLYTSDAADERSSVDLGGR